MKSIEFKRSGLVFLIALVISSASNSQSSSDVDKAINIIMQFCGGKSNVDRLVLDGNASGELELNIFTRKLGGDASLKGSVKVEKSSIEGVVAGLNGAIDRLSAEQATEFRNCAKPYIDRLLAILLPLSTTSSAVEFNSSSLVGWWEYKYDGNFNADPILFYTNDSGGLSIESGSSDPYRYSNLLVNGKEVSFSVKTRLGTGYVVLTLINDGHMVGTYRDSRGTVTYELKRDFPEGTSWVRHGCPEPIPLKKCKNGS